MIGAIGHIGSFKDASMDQKDLLKSKWRRETRNGSSISSGPVKPSEAGRKHTLVVGTKSEAYMVCNQFVTNFTVPLHRTHPKWTGAAILRLGFFSSSVAMTENSLQGSLQVAVLLLSFVWLVIIVCSRHFKSVRVNWNNLHIAAILTF